MKPATANSRKSRKARGLNPILCRIQRANRALLAEGPPLRVTTLVAGGALGHVTNLQDHDYGLQRDKPDHISTIGESLPTNDASDSEALRVGRTDGRCAL